MNSKKTIEIDRGVYKLVVEVEMEEDIPNIPDEVMTEVVETISNSVEKSKKKKKN